MSRKKSKCKYCKDSGFLVSPAVGMTDLRCGYCDYGREEAAKETPATEWHMGDLKKRLIAIDKKLDTILSNQNYEE